MTLQILQHVDARGLSCPMPIVKTAQAIKTIPSGSLVEVLATDPDPSRTSRPGRERPATTLVEQSADGGVYRFVLRRK